MTNQDNIGHKSVAQLIEARQNELGTTDHQIAMALGYTHERVITMIKQCSMRLPLNKVVELAGALDVDAASLLRLTLSETDPALLQAIERVMGPMTLSPGEIKLIQAIRKVARGRDAVPIMFDRDSLVALVVA